MRSSQPTRACAVRGDPCPGRAGSTRRAAGVVAALAGALLLAACGGTGDEAGATAGPTTTRKVTTTITEPAGPTVSMLTGRPLADPSIGQRPVVAVKFDNVEGRSTPQVGIAAAEVVYEVPVEGQVTRFLALFHATDAAPIGPIRSARGSEIGVLEELNRPLFTWHGANALLDSHVRHADIVARSFDDVPHLFYREPSRKQPYNSFAAGTAEIRATAPEGSAGPTRPILRFAQPGEVVPSPIAVPATSASVVFPPAFGGRSNLGTPVRFEWDGSRWLRYQAGHPHVDGTGTHLAVDNLIVRFTAALDSGTVDQAGSRVPTAQVIGEGEAWIFSAGKVATGTWSKPDGHTPTTYRDQQGDEIVLTPGTTWIALPYGHGSSFR